MEANEVTPGSISLPTDSLYKFMAVGGLALLIGGCWLAILAENKLRAEGVEFILRGHAASVRTKAMLEESNDELARIDRLKEQAKWFEGMRADLSKGKPPTDELGHPISAEGIKKFSERFTEESDRVLLEYSAGRERRTQLEESLTQLNAELELARIGREVDQRAAIAYWLLSGVGAVLALVGYVLWYVKLQRHIDARVRIEAGSAVGARVV